jgi:hypothetical protein
VVGCGWKWDSEKAMPPHRAPAAKAAVIRIRRRETFTILLFSAYSPTGLALLPEACKRPVELTEDAPSHGDSDDFEALSVILPDLDDTVIEAR